MTVRPQLRRGTQADRRLIVPLGDTSVGVGRMGGKGHTLSRMIASGFSVPPGFVLTVAALEDHSEGCGRSSALARCCDALDCENPEGIRRAAEEASAIVTGGPPPEGVRDVLRDAVAPLLTKGRVIVRSSAIGEDGPDHSFAGQLDSILDVATSESVEAAVLACWASHWSDRALFYRTARGIPPLGMAVVVQAQVKPLAAGVLFTSAGRDIDLPPRAVPHPMLVPAAVEGREGRASSGTRATA